MQMRWNLILFLVPGKKCIAHIVCSARQIPTNQWVLFKEAVREGIRIRRANSNTALKREFHGKNVGNIVFSVIAVSLTIRCSKKLCFLMMILGKMCRV